MYPATKYLLAILLMAASIQVGFAQAYTLNGNAVNSGPDCYAVTPAINFQNGTIWYNDQLNLSNPFDIEFYMNFGSNDADGADGMVFVLQQIGVNALGVNGSGMGYQGFNTSFGVEFDTYSNNADPFTGQNMNDPLYDHIAFLRSGDVNHASANNLAGPVQASATSANIEDGLDHIVRITWNPTNNMIQLFFDCELRLSQNVALVGGIFVGGPFVYFGFTGSTGGFNNLQRVCLQQNIIPSDETTQICAGESVEINAGGDPDATFSWSPSLGLNADNIQNPIASPTETTVYTVSYNDFCGNLLQRNFEVVVLPSPSVDAGFNASLCDGFQMDLNGTAAPNLDFEWSTLDGNIVVSANTLTPTIDTGGTYTLEVTDNFGCSNSDDVVITSIAPPIIDLGEDFSICEGSTTSLQVDNTLTQIQWNNGMNTPTIEVGPGNYSVSAQSPEGCASSDAITVSSIALPTLELGPDLASCEDTPVTLNAPSVVTWSTGEVASNIQVSATGSYSAVADNQGCSVSDDITITFFEIPLVNLPNSANLCQGESVTLSAGQIGFWSTGDNAPSIEVTTAGEYFVVITNGPCVASDTTLVQVRTLPTVDLGEDKSACIGEDFVLSAANNNIENYTWSTGDNEPFIRLYDSGEYIVEVSNSCGAATDTVNIVFEECNYFLYIPNAFTPDNDGVNDYWGISAFKIPTVEIFIYNRWGDLVFYSDNVDTPWLGDDMRNGYYVPSGIYTYLIKYTAFNAEAQSKYGHINLLR